LIRLFQCYSLASFDYLIVHFTNGVLSQSRILDLGTFTNLSNNLTTELVGAGQMFALDASADACGFGRALRSQRLASTYLFIMARVFPRDEPLCLYGFFHVHFVMLQASLWFSKSYREDNN
jgi:hypothetical protein